jgi:hypothetical protein
LDSKRDAKHLFSFYNRDHFERVFATRFDIVEKLAVPTSERTLYLMRAL